MLWKDLKVWQIYGANTDVGKTIISTLLCQALRRRAQQNALLYLKPVSTGPQTDADDGHLRRFVPGIVSKCISQFSQPLSPHLAAELDGNNTIPRSNNTILAQINKLLSQHSQSGGRYAILETAGGVLSPGPSGAVQADVYRPLRLPALLVGDSKLGGIGTTISAFESLHVRGYDVDSVIVFDDPKWGNHGYLQEHFSNHGISTHAIPPPPSRQDNSRDDELALSEYYETCSTSPAITNIVDLLQQKHFSRVSKLISLPSQAEAVVWHPFRQHGIPQNIIAIDSAYGDHFQAYNAETDPALTAPPAQQTTTGLTPLAAIPTAQPLLTPLFDASASWWTQGLGHGNPELALTAAHAAGRYGHVMFANAIHEPALDISYNLLRTLQNPRLSRVFFTDNGSTGMEVAVKMALRASCQRYGWAKQDGVGILGLQGSYHGDTIGVMNCSEPSVFNEKVDWYNPWGHWFEPPSLLMKDGIWELSVPTDVASADMCANPQIFTSIDSVFDFESRHEDAERYQTYIKKTLTRLVKEEGRRFGALILEPLLMGAGGMIFVDPLFQRTLITTIRTNPELIGVSESDTSDPGSCWSGIPIIADEVFTGLYRLGRASSSSFLASTSDPKTTSGPQPQSKFQTQSQQPQVPTAIAPDIAVHAKLLTAGLLPLAITTASEAIFQTFLSSSKTDALLHGHSYTAHAVGCSVANTALEEFRKLDRTDGAWECFKQAWKIDLVDVGPDGATARIADTEPSPSANLYSFFPPPLLHRLSHHPRLAGCFALGTVLVLKMAAPSGSAGGYTSTATTALQARLLTSLDSEHGTSSAIHSRVLGDIIYFMTSLTTTQEGVEKLGRMILMALDAEE
ncbi:uncharacterized protein A1O9_11990 [Exophiala aquamarina CBS 119918]|uniref:Dethiobiotin synthase n=1 Tax=Exophiala aquamarina CBS 119918 TaxID=1182545 RepID=A0A072P8T6_9EURO|nr:uncharacterized protein A1O9_11990 [Exophiala aquamarina CBS 119918]KEF52000.1 hypothetical protein A1O9_11990 [Exophiala aquamarina CBS 119918]